MYRCGASICCAKGGIVANPNAVDRVSWMESFAKMIKPYYPSQYIAATNIGATVRYGSFCSRGRQGLLTCQHPFDFGFLPTIHFLSSQITGSPSNRYFKLVYEYSTVGRIEGIEY